MHRSRGRRDAEFGNYTMVDIDGNDPNDEIDENLPLEVNSKKTLLASYNLTIPHYIVCNFQVFHSNSRLEVQNYF